MVQIILQLLFPLFWALLSVFSSSYLLYFAYVQNSARKLWKLKIDRAFQPEISIFIPVHNEEGAIGSKLENIKDVSYPREKIEVIVADDASEDKTLKIVEDFVENNPELNIKVARQNPRAGKSAALNKALVSSAHPIVIVSDADTRWSPDILQKALPYLADPKVGAVTGTGINRNVSQSWVTKGEETYLNFAYLLRLGESKIHSTIRFEGGFCAYKKEAFEKFDCETGSDDSGTALEVVQKGYRAILVPEAVFYTEFPTRLVGKLRIKARRANQLISLCAKCLGLMLKGQLSLPKKIAVPEMVLFFLNPILLLGLIVGSVVIVALYPLSLFSLVLVLFIAGLLLFARKIFVEILLNNLILFYALATFLFGKRYVTWEK
jgi:cellulose synthase/poly-beta-1,6-N-acetylglucosamine synthase-like glycosyltransferase